MKVAIVNTGIGNTASLLVACARLGVTAELTERPETIRAASFVILPGVGAFGPGMAKLRETGLDEAIVERAAADRPLLGICLGLQLMACESAEAPGVPGLGLLEAVVVPFRARVRVPQLGWNRVTSDPRAQLVVEGDAYFANSYHLDQVPAGMTGAWSTHEIPFVAAIERGALLGCQFHPELSGAWGAALLQRWFDRC
jgi:glutamine amidotransferase